MGRKKMIDDQTLLDLIQRYYDEICNYNPQKLKLPAIAEFVANNGYPQYRVESLRRNENARIYIKSLKQTDSEKSTKLQVVYKTLDVDHFLETNRTIAALKRALVNLDDYYKKIADTATEIGNKYQLLMRQYEETQEELSRTREEVSELQETQKALKQEMKVLKSSRETLRHIVEDYVYPDIANELLAEAGDLSNSDTIVDRERLNALLISGETTVSKEIETHSGSKVIRNIFNSFEDD